MKKYIILLFFVLGSVYSQYPTYRLFPSGVNQIEPSVVRSPVNQNILFCSAYTINSSVLSEGIYISTNGGLNWTGADNISNPPGDAGDPGPIIDKNGIFILTHQRSIPFGMYSNTSTNMGSSWGAYKTIATGDQDKGSPITDDVPASPNYGRTYLAWTRYTSPFPINISYTTNSGSNWSSLIQVNNTYNGNRSVGPSMSIGINGEVYVCWASALLNSPANEVAIGFAKSTNGGLNWQVTENAYSCNGIKTAQLSPWTIRANGYPLMDVDRSGGPRNGWIYIVTGEKNLAPSGSDPDVVFHRSTNSGQTWSSGIRVNQDPLNNGKVQFFPIIRVDEAGGLNVIYYDNRNSTDSVDVYLSRSLDGGTTWSDYRLSDHRFKPQSPQGSSGNMGDNIGVTSGNGYLYPVWMSNYGTGQIFQTWTARINYSTIGINKISEEIPTAFSLGQNFPNPFNPVTKIKFALPKSSAVKLVVYDAEGKNIRTIVSQHLSPGNYETDFDGNNLASGLYFYRIEANGFSETRKMILLK
jgi:hypothetical protein